MNFKVQLVIYFIFFFSLPIEAKIWYVVQGSSIPDPKTASNLAQNGDTIDIAYNVAPYLAYETKWPQNNLLIRGSGAGRPVLRAELFSVTQKAIFVTQGNNIVIENIVFENCKVPDVNGAGIRVEGTNLTVRNCVFTKNEMGILAGDNPESEILVEQCEFAFNGYGDGYSHNIYINHVKNLVFRYNYSHDSKIGHLVKSRAYNNYILYNRLDSPSNGTPSREIDLPNGGIAIIIGNIIRQTELSENSNIIGYGLEGLSNPAPHDICMVNNTLVNQKTNGSFVHVQSGTNLLRLINNIFSGGGSMLNGTPIVLDTISNFRSFNIAKTGFIDAQNLNFRLSDTSWAINHGTDPGLYSNNSLIASFEYVDDADYKERMFIDKIDIGAFESDISTSLINNTNDKELFRIIGNCIHNFDSQLPINILIYSALGILKRSSRLDYLEELCLNDFDAGIYFISFELNEKLIKTIKFIKN